jgi:mannose-6-phosphate isomerase-like protein (cupin superfamily)
MIILNKSNTRRAETTGLKTWLLVSQTSTHNQGVSTSLTELDVHGQQDIHSHAPEQCYYIVEGQGLMTLGAEKQMVHTGDSIFIPSNMPHGIENAGMSKLIYLTASSPVFGLEYEEQMWSLPPTNS